MSKRKYDFELPIVLGSMYAAMLPNALQSMGIWDNIPKNLKDKANKAAAAWSSAEITKEDLDSLDEKTWNLLKNQLIDKYITPRSDSSQKTDNLG